MALFQGQFQLSLAWASVSRAAAVLRSPDLIVGFTVPLG